MSDLWSLTKIRAVNRAVCSMQRLAGIVDRAAVAADCSDDMAANGIHRTTSSGEAFSCCLFGT